MKGQIQTSSIDFASYIESSDHSVGSTVTFQGIVRNMESSKELKHLFYEADEKLAIEEMNRILDDAIKKFNLIEAKAVHRIGMVKPGETSLLVVVHSSHRKEGFEACEYIVDVIKERLPVWKKDHFLDGSESWH